MNSFAKISAVVAGSFWLLSFVMMVLAAPWRGAVAESGENDAPRGSCVEQEALVADYHAAERRRALGERRTRLEIPMRRIEPGSFTMGLRPTQYWTHCWHDPPDEATLVHITRPFEIGRSDRLSSP